MRGSLMENIYCIKTFNNMDCKLSKNTKKNLLYKCNTSKNSNYRTCCYESIEYRNKISLK